MLSKVYLIDDDEVCLLSSEFIFTESRYTDGCTFFKDPREALAVLKQDLENETLPEIIILDLHIPEMNGWGFLEALKPYEDQLRHKCFIYMLTSSVDEAEWGRAQNCGLVYELLQKPFTTEKLDEIIRDIVFMRNKYA